MIEFILKNLAKIFLYLFLIVWGVGNLILYFTVQGIAFLTPLDAAQVEYLLRPYDFETSYQKAERLGYYKTPVDCFSRFLDAEKYT